MARPRKDQALDIRARAITETIRLLSETDARDLTLARVAAAVGCRPPALYGHFRDKNDLLRAVHDAGFAWLYVEKLDVCADTQGDALARLREGGRAYVRFALENPALYRLMFDPPPDSGLDVGPFDSDSDAALKSLGFLRAGIVAAQREGCLPGADPDDIAFTLWSAVHGAVSLLLQGRAPATETDPVVAAEAVVDQVMAFIAATRATTPGGSDA
ncbi:WHG domain-containing protein [Rhodospira trueperi]|uniref:DNA-binding transcriptional regulator, AcrR family n=1 Tax=Rhodospira trueperi TaxID=69960 RepID=A0A1G7DS45_9PROT|nr:WHG domain-containing protein [Rhodospira trueperi]SDE54349.1 DNA-binding transcriptional regulator, AcrR family [Rhodospira trueperi]